MPFFYIRNMNRYRKANICAAAASALLLASCASHKDKQVAIEPQPLPQSEIGTLNYMPKATVFRMSGDYADKVGITLDAAGNLTYYPAPSDISANSAPVKLAGGWWLNRQGLSAGSVFTKWTFEEYSRLDKTPTMAELKAAVIPGAYVTDMTRLPITMNEALADPKGCDRYLPQD